MAPTISALIVAPAVNALVHTTQTRDEETQSSANGNTRANFIAVVIALVLVLLLILDIAGFNWY